MGIEDFIDMDILYLPAYWIIVALAVLGLAIGFGAGGFIGSEEFQVPVLIKGFILICIFPIAYIIVKIISR